MKKCSSCLSTINYFAIRCPYCTSFQSKTAKGGGGYILIFISILGIWGWITSPKDISGDVHGLRNIAERTMHKAGIEFWNSCGEQVHKPGTALVRAAHRTAQKRTVPTTT